MLEIADPIWVLGLAESYAEALAQVGEHSQAVELLGAADAHRDRDRMPRRTDEHQHLNESFAAARAELTASEWDKHYEAGREAAVDEALKKVADGPH